MQSSIKMGKYHRLEVISRSFFEGGLRDLICTSFRIARSGLFGQRRLIFGRMPSAQHLIPPGKGSDCKIVSITSSDMIDDVLKDNFLQYRRYMGWDTETMLRKGACLWVVYLNGELAHVSWTRTGDKIRSYFFPMTPECVLISHSVTIPEFRGRGLFPVVLEEIVRMLAQKGFKRFYIDCSDWNQSSKRAIERAGFSLIGRGKCKRKGRLAWYQESPPDFTQAETKENLI